MDPLDLGGMSTTRGSNWATSEGESGDQGNKKQIAEITDAPSHTQIGVLDAHECPRDNQKKIDLSNDNTQHDCIVNSRQPIPDQITQTQITLEMKETATTEDFMKVEDLFCSSLDPPITKATLSELDVPRIIFNPKLRHDINFDPDLHFRPNMDGDSGRRKFQKAAEFWDIFQIQLQSFMLNPSAFSTKHVGREWSLPSTLRTVSEILATLVPPDDRSAVEEILDVELLMQQIQKGVADLGKLALWLSYTLKSHCAPMRDEWVDEMVHQLSLGNRNRDVAMTAQGLQTLLGVLEAMKLDVANHQIRCLRPLLIQETVEFEKSFFMKKIVLRKIDLDAAHTWFCAAKSLQETPNAFHKLQGNMSTFFKVFTDLVLPSRAEAAMPETFMFDEDRIDKIRSDILDAINLDICMRLIKNHRRIYLGLETRSTSISLTSSLPSLSPLRFSSPSSLPGACQSPLTSSIMLDYPKSYEPSQTISVAPTTTQYNDKATSESVDWMVDSELGDGHSPTESSAFPKRTSISSDMAFAPTFSLSQPRDRPYLAEEEFLRQSLLAIIGDTPSTGRWQQSCPAIALQLLRSAPNLNSLSILETKLHFHLSNPKSAVFKFSEAQMLAELYPILSKVAASYANLTSIQLFEVASLPRPLQGQLPAPRHTLNEIAKHMAHIGVLHWRVWEHLAYSIKPDGTNPHGEISEVEPVNGEQQSNRVSYIDTGKSRRGSPSRADSKTKSIPMGG